MATKGKGVRGIGSTNSKRRLDLADELPAENPRWRWNAREKKWDVYFLGYNWVIGRAEEDHVWFLADIHRLNLFTQLTRKRQ